MTQYIVRRILGLIPVLIGVSLLVFTLTRIIPADPALLILGERATPEARADLRERLGLNEPLFFNPAACCRRGIRCTFRLAIFQFCRRRADR